MTAPIPLLEPVVLNEVVRDLRPAPELVLSNALPRIQIPTSVYRWDILRNSYTMAQFNVPNAEAQLVDQPGRAQGFASLAYTREKKTFEPTTTMWLRAIGTTDGIANAEQAVLDEIRDLNNRVNILQEFTCWKALQGSIHISNIGAGPVDVDFGFTADNYAHPQVGWDTASPVQIISDLEQWTLQSRRHAGVDLTDAWLSQPTLNRVYTSIVTNSESGGLLLTDAMRTAYFQSGFRQLPGLMGINWHVVESQFDLTHDSDENPRERFLDDDMIIFTNLNSGSPMKIVEGPTADFGNSQGAIGRFMKTYEQEDPSARYALLESRWLPVITRPDRFLIIPDVTQTS